nr:MAG TPA: hypothetical protein [Caudoviricetes sp.]
MSIELHNNKKGRAATLPFPLTVLLVIYIICISG